MKRISSLISGVMVKLGALPGLGFLQSYVMSARGMKTRFGQRKGDYETYITSGRSAIGDVRDASGRPRRQVNQDVDAEDHMDDDDYMDDYDDYDEDSVSMDSVDNFEDDYPASDQYNTYYNDDYGSH